MFAPTRSWLASAVLLLAGCGAEPTVLVHLGFAAGQCADSALALQDPMQRVHGLGPGWGSPGKEGVWSLGHEAVINLYLLGKKHQLTLRCATGPRLSQAGQEVRVALNGTEIGRLRFSPEAGEQVLTVDLPPEAVLQGANQLLLTASLHALELDPPEALDQGPVGVFLRDLRVTARLDERELETWGRALRPRIDPDPELPIEPAAAVEQDTAAPQPDVLVILMDAARPDHFGCYGYERDTTPFIDGLARKGLVFREVFSHASYTLTAVPSLFTGRSFDDHGVLLLGDALSEEFITLPEVLRGAGYRTLAFTASPNASRATGIDQGFDEFHEVWKDAPKTPAGRLNFELPAAALARRAQAGFGPEPVFCYVHILPPHEPYVPGPAHDLFGDPSYDGPLADGSVKTQMSMLRGERAVSEADRQELLDLYDGHLHRGDALVRAIVEGWHGLGRERELLVAIVSDHGEAFGEHGELSHNTTVYDEMTRIPLIISPAELAANVSDAQDSLLALSDVMPLILRAAHVVPDPGTSWPRRFLDVLAEPAAPRLGVPITAYGSLIRGLRTPDHLAVCRDLEVQELYDVSLDPLQRANVRERDADTWIELSGALSALLAQPPGRGPRRVELSGEEKDLLRTLGYL